MLEKDKKKLNLNYSEHEAVKKNLIGTNGSDHHRLTSLTKIYDFFLVYRMKTNLRLIKKHFIYTVLPPSLHSVRGKPQSMIVMIGEKIARPDESKWPFVHPTPYLTSTLKTRQKLTLHPLPSHRGQR
jgi:hypothetical protein